jgi:hypothetical protein
MGKLEGCTTAKSLTNLEGDGDYYITATHGVV